MAFFPILSNFAHSSSYVRDSRRELDCPITVGCLTLLHRFIPIFCPILDDCLVQKLLEKWRFPLCSVLPPAVSFRPDIAYAYTYNCSVCTEQSGITRARSSKRSHACGSERSGDRRGLFRACARARILLDLSAAAHSILG